MLPPWLRNCLLASVAFASWTAGHRSAAARLPAQTPVSGDAGASGWNPSALGVSWASDFTRIAGNQINLRTDSRLRVRASGDGNTDDTAALRDALRLASASGGGVVYFPAGDYKIVASSGAPRGDSLKVPSNVIMDGEGPAKSHIWVNDPHPELETDSVETWGGIDFRKASLSGMANLGIYAVTSPAKPCALLWNRGSVNVRELFFDNLDVRLENCRSFWFSGTTNLLVQNSRFDGHSTENGPIYVVGNSYVSLLGNKITYHRGRVFLHHNDNLLVRDNELVRNGDNAEMQQHTAIESGGMELSFSRNVQILKNRVQTLNAPADETDDGEAIMSQQSIAENVLDVGSASSFASNSLTDSDARWGSVTQTRLSRSPHVVAILTGPAAGEWRSIQSIDLAERTITVTEPWNPVPTPGSLYSVFMWTLAEATIQGNTLIDNPNGIVIYDGCLDCVIDKNVLTNSRGIILRTVDEGVQRSRYPEGRRVHQLAINVTISGNVVSNTSGVRPAYIALDAEAFDHQNYRGSGMFNIKVVNNVINPFPANPSQAYNPQKNEIAQEGFFPCFLFGPAPAKDPLNVVFRNIEFRNNSVNLPIKYRSDFVPYTSRECVTSGGAVQQAR